jgi:hypothetical protein
MAEQRPAGGGLAVGMFVLMVIGSAGFFLAIQSGSSSPPPIVLAQAPMPQPAERADVTPGNDNQRNGSGPNSDSSLPRDRK